METESRSGKLGVGRWGVAILGAMVTGGLTERPVCQCINLNPQLGVGHLTVFPTLTKAPKVACAQACLLETGRDLWREFPEPRCLEGEQLFAVELKEVPKSAGNRGSG